MGSNGLYAACGPVSNSGPRYMADERTWLAFSPETTRGLIRYAIEHQVFGATLVDDPHVARLSALLTQFDTSNEPELGFLLRSESCYFGTLEDEQFTGVGLAVAREFDLQNTGRSCLAFKRILGVLLSTYVGECKAAIERARLRRFLNDDDQLVFAEYIRDAYSSELSKGWESLQTVDDEWMDYRNVNG